MTIDYRLQQNSALNLETYPDKVWPEGRVPYRLQEGLSEIFYSCEHGLKEEEKVIIVAESERLAIAQAFEEYREKTCVRFVPKKDDDVDHLVLIRNEDNGYGKFCSLINFTSIYHCNFSCSSYVGRAGGNQTVSLEISKCFTKGQC